MLSLNSFPSLLASGQAFSRDLRKEEPRNASERLAGYELGARCLDRCRATILRWQGTYTFNCPMDQEFLTKASLDADEFKTFVATGASDAKVEDWIRRRSRKAA